jgi:hypothetical protein
MSSRLTAERCQGCGTRQHPAAALLAGRGPPAGGRASSRCYTVAGAQFAGWRGGAFSVSASPEGGPKRLQESDC